MVAAVSVGLLAADVRDLRVADVAEDGSSVAGPDGPLAVPSGARAYLRAQRALRGLEQAAPGSPLFARRGRPLTPKAVADAAWGALAQVGVALDARELARRRTPSERWLAQRGLHVRPSPGRGGPLRRTPTCRAHRVPRDLDVDGSVLSHSQNICWISGRHADVASHMRPARNGFELTVTRDCELGQVMDVRQHGRPHGELIALSAGDGRIWFQRTGSARPRSLEAIVATLERDYPDALGGVARGP